MDKGEDENWGELGDVTITKMMLQSRTVFHFNEKKFVVNQHFPKQWFAVL